MESIDITKAPKLNSLRSSSLFVAEQPIELPEWEDDRKALISRSSESPRVWKPITQSIYLNLFLVVFSAGCIVVLQIFLDRSNRNTGVLFAPNIQDLSPSKRFSYIYLPTLVSLALGSLWTWIDLDVKRLQPFVQISRKSGASGKDSILLHYPFDFVALLPFSSIKNRYDNVLAQQIKLIDCLDTGQYSQSQ